MIEQKYINIIINYLWHDHDIKRNICMEQIYKRIKYWDSLIKISDHDKEKIMMLREREAHCGVGISLDGSGQGCANYLVRKLLFPLRIMLRNT